jgi:Cu-Zn family superoxide dismutase
MRKYAQACALLSLILCVGCGQSVDNAAETSRTALKPATAEVARAVIVLTPIGQSGVTGTVFFTRQGDAVQIHGAVSGLEPGLHGLHVHQYGDLTDKAQGKSAGDHFNPTGQPHGRPQDAHHHVGDFGNIEADANGIAKFSLKAPHIVLEGPEGIVGRSLVVHAKADKFTQPAGDAGDRVAFGVIGIAQPEAAGD